MPYIYDSEASVDPTSPILTIGSLVQYGSVIKDRNKNNIGIIIGVEHYNFGVGESTFLVYSNGSLVRTSLVFPIWDNLK